MKQALLHGPHDLRVEEVPDPEPGEDGAVVRIRRCAICGSDTALYEGRKAAQYPFPLGHEASGEVVACGPKAPGVAEGDRITVWCHFGALAEFTCLRPERLAVGHLGATVTFDQGASAQLLCACLRGVDTATITPNSKVLVLGLGGVGLMTFQGARAFGAPIVLGADPLQLRREVGVKLGLEAVFDPSAEGWDRAIAEHFGPLDIVYDCMENDTTPAGDTLGRALRLLRPQAEYVMIGLGDRPRRLVPTELVDRQVTIKPSFATLERTRELMNLGLKWIADGTVDVDTMTTHRFALDQAPEAMHVVAERGPDLLKVMIHVYDD